MKSFTVRPTVARAWNNTSSSAASVRGGTLCGENAGSVEGGNIEQRTRNDDEGEDKKQLRYKRKEREYDDCSITPQYFLYLV
jgi:hypothetical protein